MRFGFVGLGWASRAFHIPALKAIPTALVVGGCDNSPEQRASWERETGVKAFDTIERLVEEGNPEVLVIATPPDSHARLCIRALELGTHVLCEKPFVSTVAEAQEVLAAAAAAGKSVAVNHEFREKPFCKAIKQKIDSGSEGRLIFCQIWQLMNLKPWDEPVAWRAAMPNRTLFEGGVHLVDLLLHIFGVRPDAVYARHSSGDPSHDADAIQLVTLEFPGDRLAQITIDRMCPAGTRYFEMRADCERSSLRASEGGRTVIQIGKKRAESTGLRVDFGPGGLAWREQGLKRTTLARAPRNPGVQATRLLLQSIIAALEEGREPPSSGREARDVLTVIEAAYESHRTGSRIELEWRDQAERPGTSVI